MGYIRLEIITKDKIGITLKILQELYEKEVSLTSLEVFPEKVCIKIEEIHRDKKENIIEEIYKIEDIKKIKEVELLSYEEGERKLLAVLDSVEDGIISLDRFLKVQTINSYAENFLGVEKQEVIDLPIVSLFRDEKELIDCILNHKKQDNVELNNPYGNKDRKHMISWRGIFDDNNNLIGGVISIKDINKALKMVSVIKGDEEEAFKHIAGNSKAIMGCKKLSAIVAKSNSTVLIRGESGTGKELFATAIHNISERRMEPFIAINCAALPENLIESELFGHEKGSFTGAFSTKEGIFKRAHGGTLFLDEIGELPITLQAKILRVIQEGVFTKVGGTKEERIDVRIIGATNRNLEEMIKNKTFRQDLYYRLNVIPIFIPPLRERREDISPLVFYFIRKFNKSLKKNIKGMEEGFMQKLMQYELKGNARELQNIMERAMLLCEGEMLRGEELFFNEEYNIENIIKEEKTQQTLEETLNEVEKREIEKVLEEGKSIRKTAKLLGISHTTLINKMRKHNINVNILNQM